MDEEIILIKSYFTRMLTDDQYQTFPKAQKHAVEFRSTGPEISFLSRHDRLMVFLAPLVYRFPDEMDIPQDVSRAARNCILSVLQGKDIQENIRIYIDLFTEFETSDRNNLMLSLFTNYHDLIASKQYVEDYDIPEDTRELWLSHISNTQDTLDKYIKILGYEKDLQVFLEKMEAEKKSVVTKMMDKAYWDLFQKLVDEGDYSLLLMCTDEIKKMILEVTADEKSVEFMDTKYIHEQLKAGLFTKERYLGFFREILLVLRHADAEDFEKIYDKILDDQDKTVAQYFEIIYTMVMSLKLKIDAIKSHL
jgi:hypothetical protein